MIKVNLVAKALPAVCVCITLLFPSMVSALNLKLSVITALARAEETKIASSQVRQSRFRVVRSEAGDDARVTLRGRVGPQFQNSETNDTEETYLFLRGSASLVKPILDGEGTRFRTESSELQLLATQYQSRSVLERTAIDVIQAYLDVVYQQEIVRLHSANITEFRNIEEIIAARRANGAATEADLLLVKSRVISANSALNRARLNLRQSEDQYKVLVGPIENDMIIPFAVDDVFFQNYELMAEKMRSQNSSLQQSKYNRRSSLADLNVIRSNDSVFVDGALESQYSNTFSGGQGQTITVGAYIDVRYNFSLGDSLELEVGEQQERIKELAILRELLVRDLGIQLQSEYSSYESIKQVIRAIEKELQANKGVLAAQKEQQKIGQVDLIDILGSQERINSAQIRLLQSRQEDQISRYRLLQLTGELLAFFRD